MWVPESHASQKIILLASSPSPHRAHTMASAASRWNPSPPRESAPPRTTASRVAGGDASRSRAAVRRMRESSSDECDATAAPRTLTRADTRGAFRLHHAEIVVVGGGGGRRVSVACEDGRMMRPASTSSRRVSRRSSRRVRVHEVFADVWVRDAARSGPAQSGHRHAPRGTLGSLGRRQYTWESPEGTRRRARGCTRRRPPRTWRRRGPRSRSRARQARRRSRRRCRRRQGRDRNPRAVPPSWRSALAASAGTVACGSRRDVNGTLAPGGAEARGDERGGRAPSVRAIRGTTPGPSDALARERSRLEAQATTTLRQALSRKQTLRDRKIRDKCAGR